MSFQFERDYLEDLEPVLSELRAEGRTDITSAIDECKAAGLTGGEILSCINSRLRRVLGEKPSNALLKTVENYLSKAPGY